MCGCMGVCVCVCASVCSVWVHGCVCVDVGEEVKGKKSL